MKKTVLVSLFAAAMIPAFASAADLTINFTGNITDQTCTISNATGGALNVAMPSVSASQFKAVGDVGGATPFQVTLTNCPATVTKVAGLFELGPNVDTTTGNLKIATATAGKAANVQVQLLDSTGAKVRADGGKTPSVNISSGGATINMFSQYYATAATVTAGKTDTSVGFTVVYN
ncbi:fimbrial protein [Herbaspirillum robiniae]|uniref:Fimbrial protein n=1 Tax=Herbaspirillum robiniae TaxID=2014887 RepID=A0A246WRJ4_9BURK|nr:fimbrial protein [Herbaspirillum robiniae]OWY28692.1 fimbrial protein [Herbaspirillum robiniae]